MGRFKEAVRVRDVAGQQGIIAISCLECRHRGFLTPAQVPARLRDQLLYHLPLKCTACGSRTVRALPYIPLAAAH
jgi:hypothetical protein